MQFERQAGEFCIVPSHREHELLYEAVELALDGAATGGAPLTPEQAEAYLSYHQLGPKFGHLAIGMDIEDLGYLTECLEERAVDFTKERDCRAARIVAAQMRRALNAQSRGSV